MGYKIPTEKIDILSNYVIKYNEHTRSCVTEVFKKQIYKYGSLCA